VALDNALDAGELDGVASFSGGFGVDEDGDIYDVDVYKLTMTAPGRLNVNAFVNTYFSNDLTAPYLSIVRDVNKNGSLDDGEQLAVAQGPLSAQLGAGTYYVLASSVVGQAAYDLRLMADYAGNSIPKARPMGTVTGTTTVKSFYDYIEQNFGPGSDTADYYSFTLPSTCTVTLKTVGVDGEDLSLSLIQDKNNNGVLDGGETLTQSKNVNSPKEQVARTLAPGKYLVLVSGFNGATNYNLAATFAGDPDNTISKVDARPGNIKALGSFADGRMDPSSDVDLYRITAAAGQRVSFDLDSRNASNLDTVLRLFKPDRTQLAINNDGKAPGEAGSKFSYLEYVFPSAGNYYVGISLNGNSNYDPKTGANNVAGVVSTGDYRLYLKNLGTTAPTVLRVSAGGGSFTDANGNFFAGDSGFSGGVKSTTVYAVANTTDDVLFATNRSGSSFSFSQAVANGSYQLTLNFADPTSTAAGQRKFNVFAEGTKVLSSFDIFATAGSAKTAVTKSFNVNVTDGQIDLSFAGVFGNALVSSISLVHV
jgi:hypothetical protein